MWLTSCLILLLLSPPFYKKIEGAVSAAELFPILFQIPLCSRFLLGKANKGNMDFFFQVKSILAVKVIQ